MEDVRLLEVAVNAGCETGEVFGAVLIAPCPRYEVEQRNFRASVKTISTVIALIALMQCSHLLSEPQPSSPPVKILACVS